MGIRNSITYCFIYYHDDCYIPVLACGSCQSGGKHKDGIIYNAQLIMHNAQLETETETGVPVFIVKRLIIRNEKII